MPVALRALTPACLFLLPACASNPKPQTGAGDFEGPPIRVDSASGSHVLVMDAPHSGYSFLFDRSVGEGDRSLVFVSVEAPDPSMVYTPAIVEQRLGTGIDAETPVAVYARMLTASRQPLPYRRAAQSENYK